MTREQAQDAIFHDLAELVKMTDGRGYDLESVSAIVGDAAKYIARDESPNPRRRGQKPTVGELVNVMAAMLILARESMLASKTPN